MINPHRARNLRRAVGAAIIDDQNFDPVNAFDSARDVRDSLREGVFFVETRDLNN
jgi:hypothetical protein